MKKSRFGTERIVGIPKEVALVRGVEDCARRSVARVGMPRRALRARRSSE